MSSSPKKAQAIPKQTKEKSVSQPGSPTGLRPGSKRKQPDCDLTTALNQLKKDLNSKLETIISSMSNLRTEIKEDINTLKNDLRKEMSDLRRENSEMKKQYQVLSAEVATLQQSVSYYTDHHADINKRIVDLDKQMSSVSSGSSCETMHMLEAKIDTLEQQARQCNIELCNVPEKRSENLMTILESISKHIRCEISNSDVVSIHKVPHAHKDSGRPKNIIVKFASRILRDNVIKAFRIKKRVSSDGIGITGTPCTIYMNEHLTLRNKQLFRSARDTAKKFKYRYVWVKNATILVRETESSAVIAIRSIKDIDKIRSDA